MVVVILVIACSSSDRWPQVARLCDMRVQATPRSFHDGLSLTPSIPKFFFETWKRVAQNVKQGTIWKILKPLGQPILGMLEGKRTRNNREELNAFRLKWRFNRHANTRLTLIRTRANLIRYAALTRLETHTRIRSVERSNYMIFSRKIRRVFSGKSLLFPW